jgi:hypothetical protein
MLHMQPKKACLIMRIELSIVGDFCRLVLYTVAIVPTLKCTRRTIKRLSVAPVSPVENVFRVLRFRIRGGQLVTGYKLSGPGTGNLVRKKRKSGNIAR